MTPPNYPYTIPLVAPVNVGKGLNAFHPCQPLDDWILIQRRVDDTVEFFSTIWSDYVTGFGEPHGNYWMGLEQMHQLTLTPHELFVYLELFDGVVGYARYSSFSIGDAASKYTITVSGYNGTAGDSLSMHSGYPYSTRNNDNSVGGGCTAQYGSWWYDACHHSNLNGRYLGGYHDSYADGMEWHSYMGIHYSYKVTEMRVRPI